MLLETIPAVTTKSFNTTFVPQFLLIVADGADALHGKITISVNVQGDGVIMNLDPDGVDSMANINKFVDLTNITAQWIAGKQFQMAEGLVQNKNVTWTVKNDHATIGARIFGFSKQKRATFYCTYMSQVALQNSGADFTRFAYLAVPKAVYDDNFTVRYNDGTSNAGARSFELLADNAYHQSTPQVAVNNISPARVEMVTIIPTANRSVYIMRYQPVAGAVDAAAIARG